MPNDNSTPTWPVCEPDEQEAALRVLRSGRLNYWTGEEGKLFESEFAAHHGRTHAVAVANGTLALELALHAFGVGPGDEVIVPSRTFVATASCVVVRGARPVFADVDADSQNLTAETVEPCITPRTKAIICVHLAGWPCDMESLRQLADRHDLRLIEDCAQAHGARLHGRPVGSFGDAAAFSFCQDKIMTTAGEGGMLLLDDDRAWRRAWSYKDHGKDWERVHSPGVGAGFRWLHASIGTNWRLTEVQSAIGRVQLGKLGSWVRQRQANAAALAGSLANHPALRIPIPSAQTEHSYYKFYAFVRPERLAPGWSRDRILQETVEGGANCFSGSCSEVYLEDAFSDHQRPAIRLATAQSLGATSLMLLTDPAQTESSLARSASKLATVATRALNFDFGSSALKRRTA